MTPAQQLAVRLSQVRERLNQIGGLEGDAYTDEVRTEGNRALFTYQYASRPRRCRTKARYAPAGWLAEQPNAAVRSERQGDIETGFNPSALSALRHNGSFVFLAGQTGRRGMRKGKNTAHDLPPSAELFKDERR